MQTAESLYSEQVQSLAKSEQLRLASMILAGLTESVADVLDYSDQWSEEDMQDAAIFSAKYAAESMGEE